MHGSVYRSPVDIFSKTTKPNFTKFGMQHVQGKRHKQFHFMTPTPRKIYFGVKSLKMMDRTKLRVIMTKDGSIKIV